MGEPTNIATRRKGKGAGKTKPASAADQDLLLSLFAGEAAKSDDGADQASALLSVIPRDKELEEDVVISCILNPDERKVCLAILEPEDFFFDLPKAVWDAILALAEDDREPTEDAIARRLRDTGVLDYAEALLYLAGLSRKLPTAIGARDRAQDVVEYHRKRMLLGLGIELTNRAIISSGSSSHQIIDHVLKEIDIVESHGGRLGSRSVAEIIDGGLYDKMLEWMADPRGVGGIPTGIPSLDQYLLGGGIRLGKFFVVAATTSMGKSTLMRYIAANVARAGHRVSLFSLEQDAEEATEELILMGANINSTQYDRTGQPVSQADEAKITNAIVAVHELPIRVDDEPALTPDKIRRKLVMEKARFPDLEVVVIDYLHIIQPNKYTKGQGKGEQEINAMALQIRDDCKKLNIACIIGSQLNREVGDKTKNPDFRPKLGHLRMSGAIAEYAYCVLGIYREDYYGERGLIEPQDFNSPYFAGEDAESAWTPTNNLEIIILKQQRGPAGKTAKITFDPVTRLFHDPLTPTIPPSQPPTQGAFPA